MRGTDGPLLRDRFLDDLLENYKGEDGPEFDCSPGRYCCTDHTHSAEWNGPNAYHFRVRAGLSRRAIRDALLARGLPTTIADVGRWENACSGGQSHDNVPSFEVVRNLATLYGCQPGNFLACCDCEMALRPIESARDPAPVQRFLDALPSMVTQARRVRGLSPRSLARESGARLQDVVWIERGHGHAVDCDALLAVLLFLGLPTTPSLDDEAATVAA